MAELGPRFGVQLTAEQHAAVDALIKERNGAKPATKASWNRQRVVREAIAAWLDRQEGEDLAARRAALAALWASTPFFERLARVIAEVSEEELLQAEDALLRQLAPTATETYNELRRAGEPAGADTMKRAVRKHYELPRLSLYSEEVERWLRKA